MKMRIRFGRKSENNKLLPFFGKDGLNQRSRGYWHKVYWAGPIFFSIVSDKRSRVA